MVDTTKRISLWLISIAVCILIIDLLGVFFYGSCSG